MGAHRFDDLARTLATRISRRLAIGSALAVMASVHEVLQPDVALAQAPTPTPLPVCSDPARPGVGCSCTTGAQDPCGPSTLLCCPTVPNAAPGAEGVCTPASVGCNPTGRPPCTGHGCRCGAGTENPCSNGLICCPNNPGASGGPGMCAAPDACGNGPASRAPQALPVA